MWERITGWLRLLWDSGLQAKINSEEIKKLRRADEKFIGYALTLEKRNELLSKDIEMLRQQLQHERELRERDIKELKMALQLQISEELRRISDSRN
jgi:hypothetical protein